jgi:hypothetical protein
VRRKKPWLRPSVLCLPAFRSNSIMKQQFHFHTQRLHFATTENNAIVLSFYLVNTGYMLTCDSIVLCNKGVSVNVPASWISRASNAISSSQQQKPLFLLFLRSCQPSVCGCGGCVSPLLDSPRRPSMLRSFHAATRHAKGTRSDNNSYQ